MDNLEADIDAGLEARRNGKPDQITRPPIKWGEIADDVGTFIGWLIAGCAIAFALAWLTDRALARNDYPMPADYIIEHQPPTTTRSTTT
jgi:hypothetical protein